MSKMDLEMCIRDRTMGSKSIGADVVYAWPGAVIGMMNPSEAVKIMYAKAVSYTHLDVYKRQPGPPG